MKLIMIALNLVLIGCIEVRDVKSKDPEGQTLDSKIQYGIEPLAHPQKYLVNFFGVSCDSHFRKTSPQKKVEVASLQNCSHVVTEAGVHEYSFKDLQVQVLIPTDLVIDNKVTLSQLPVEELDLNAEVTHRLKIKGRLYFKRGAQLITEGKRVLIQADVIETEGAEVLSFEVGQQAQATMNGRNGGLIWIKAREIKGSMKFILRGENGGDGENHFITRKKVHELNLAGGHGGNSGRVFIEVENLKNSYLKTEMFPGALGKGTEVKSSCFMIQNCQEQTLRPKGKDGSEGLPERSCLIRKGECSEEII
ncbi:MAG: hypothetical protein ACK5V3_08990 [Bdellovibrionales bacterium]